MTKRTDEAKEDAARARVQDNVVGGDVPPGTSPGQPPGPPGTSPAQPPDPQTAKEKRAATHEALQAVLDYWAGTSALTSEQIKAGIERVLAGGPFGNGTE